MKKKFSILLAVLIAVSVFGFTGCNNDSASNDDRIKIGGLAPLTGNVAVYGVSVKNGAMLAVEEINASGGVMGKQLDLNFLDEKGDPAEAVNAYNRLISDKVVAIIGDVTSGPTAAIAPSSATEGIPVITPSATALNVTTFGNNLFRVCFTDPFQGVVLAQFANDSLQCTTAAVLANSSSDYSMGIAEAFKVKAAELGITIVADETYGETDKDFKAQLNNIKNTAPDVLLVPDYYAVNSLITAQARELGLMVPILGGDGWDGITTTTDESNYDVLNDVYFSNHYAADGGNSKVTAFVEKFTETYKEPPTAFAALAYDAVYMLAEAMEKAQSTDYDKVVDALANINFTSGLTGNIHYEGTGDPVKSVTIIRMVDGEYTFFTEVKP